jgi:hypothetical protein
MKCLKIYYESNKLLYGRGKNRTVIYGKRKKTN